MTFTVVIPARYASTRLPGKPLLQIAGKPMIQHVYERCVQSEASRVLVATDDDRIADAVTQFGGDVCMTSSHHRSGTDRLQEVAHTLKLANEHCIVNVQGDEPLIPPAVINQVAKNLLENRDVAAATLAEPIRQMEEFLNPSAVKVVMAKNGQALYFSRACIPWPRDAWLQQPDLLPASLRPNRHIGIYAYRVALLHEFVHWPVGALEQIESLEQLRILENGRAIHVELSCETVPAGVDTPADLERLQRLFDPLLCLRNDKTT